MVYERVADYWGADLPVNRGSNNFDEVRYEYYRDANVAMEAFKAGAYDIRMENASKFWATAYTGPMFDAGWIVKEEIPNQLGTGMQGFAFNLRRPLFQDAKVRQALAYAFDFEWTNRTIMYGQYARTRATSPIPSWAPRVCRARPSSRCSSRFATSCPRKCSRRSITRPRPRAKAASGRSAHGAALLGEAGWQVEGASWSMRRASRSASRSC